MWIAVLAGFIFGLFMAYARVNRYDTISGMAVMKDWTAAKTMGIAIAIGAVLIAIAVQSGFASYHVKPLLMGGAVWGGFVFAAFAFIAFLLTGKLFYRQQGGVRYATH